MHNVACILPQCRERSGRQRGRGAQQDLGCIKKLGRSNGMLELLGVNSISFRDLCLRLVLANHLPCKTRTTHAVILAARASRARACSISLCATRPRAVDWLGTDDELDLLKKIAVGQQARTTGGGLWPSIEFLRRLDAAPTPRRRLGSEDVIIRVCIRHDASCTATIPWFPNALPRFEIT